MKSHFAKFIDGTIGAIMLFAAITAVLRYYTTLELAAFSSAALTACIYTMLAFVGKKKNGEAAISKAAEEMFYDFMFENDGYPAKRLCAALKSRGVNAEVKAGAVYSAKCAAFFSFGAPLDINSTARIVARAKRNGAEKATVFCKNPPLESVEVKGFKLKIAGGDETYRLFASLGALPERKFERPGRARFGAFRGALDRSKMPRYAVLSASLFGVYFIARSIVALVCASVSAALFAVTAAFAVAESVRTKKTAK